MAMASDSFRISGRISRGCDEFLVDAASEHDCADASEPEKGATRGSRAKGCGRSLGAPLLRGELIHVLFVWDPRPLPGDLRIRMGELSRVP